LLASVDISEAHFPHVPVSLITGECGIVSLSVWCDDRGDLLRWRLLTKQSAWKGRRLFGKTESGLSVGGVISGDGWCIA
jgi:hypothetical protein